MNRKNLILVRAGDKSLHPQWLGPDRAFDVAVSYYEDFPQRYQGQYDFLHLFKKTKWPAILDFIQTHQALIARYDYIWFPDDDLLSNCATINQFFHWCRHFDFTIAQPSLTHYSHHSWPITLSQPDTIARLTDFVEIMAPCFKVSHLPLFQDTFVENTSGFGYEWLWKDIAMRHDVFQFGIVDATPIHHTRPVGSAGHGGAAGNPYEEMRQLLQKYQLNATEPTTLHAIAPDQV